MGLCELVASIAEAIAASWPLTPREAYLLYVLKGMPLFRDVRRLDLWDAAYSQVSPETDDSETERLIRQIYELGEHNMYSGFDPKATQDLYRALLPLLEAANVAVPKVPQLTDW